MSEQKNTTPAFAAFRFIVAIDDTGQAAFTECTLPSVEWTFEAVKEGGLNTYIHQLPGQRKAAKISLKNGVGKSDLMDWFLEVLGGTMTRKNVTVTLLNSLKEPVMVWHLADALPSKWEGPQLDSDSDTVAIQTLDLICGEVTASYD